MHFGDCCILLKPVGSVWSPHPHRSINQPVLTKLFFWHKHAQPLLVPEMLHPQPQLPTQGSCKYCRFKELQKNLRPTLEKKSKTCSVAQHKVNKLRRLGPATEPCKKRKSNSDLKPTKQQNWPKSALLIEKGCKGFATKMPFASWRFAHCVSACEPV